MPQVDVIAECFVRCAPADVAAVLAEPPVLAALWPGLRLTVFQDRGPLGVRWSTVGALVGSCEVWLEAFGPGTLVHCYLRTDPTRPDAPTHPVTVPARRALRETRRRQRTLHAALWVLKDRLEGD